MGKVSGLYPAAFGDNDWFVGLSGRVPGCGDIKCVKDRLMKM